MELAGREKLDPIGAVVGRPDLVQRVEIERVVAQVELAGVPGLELQLERAVEVARPDVKGAVLVGDLDRVVDGDAIGDPNRDDVDGKVGVAIEADVLDPPFLRRGARLHEDVGDGRRRDRVAVRIDDRPAARQAPAAFGGLDAVIVDHRPAIDDAHQVGRRLAELHRSAARGGRPGLLELPVLPASGRLRKQLLERRAVDDVANGVADRRAARKRPEATRGILDIDAAIDQRDLPLGPAAEQHGHQLARGLECLSPVRENRARLLSQQEEIGLGHRRGCGGEDLAEFDVVRGGDGEVRDRADALRVDREIGLPRRASCLASEAAVAFDRLEDRLVHAPGGAAGEFDLARAEQAGALRCDDVERLRIEPDRHDAERFEGQQLARIGETVAVAVTPDEELRPDRVGRGDTAVAVAAILGKIVPAEGLVAALELVAEHLGDVVDAPVVVQVADEEAVVAGDPSGQRREQVVVEVEEDLAVVDGHRLQAVAVQVEDERVEAGGPGHVLGQAHRRATQPRGRVGQSDLLVDGENHADGRR